jgi:hypothetical protein
MKSLFVSVVLLLVPAFAQAQIGSGWREYFPRKEKLEQENSEKHSSLTTKGGVETFKLWKNPAKGLPKNGRQRIEWRIDDNYTRGSTQFQGDFFVVKGGGPSINDDVSIMQVFQTLIVSVSDVNGGTLKVGKGRVSGIKGEWVTINVIHDADKRTSMVYITRNKKAEVVHKGPSKFSDDYNHKYGLYNCAEANPEVRWRNIRYFSKGSTGL